MYRLIYKSDNVGKMNWAVATGILQALEGEFDPPISDSLKQRYGEEDGELRFPEVGWEALALLRDIQEIENLPEWDEESVG